MNSLLYLIAIILLIGWIFGAFVYSAGGLIHILLVLDSRIIQINWRPYADHLCNMLF